MPTYMCQGELKLCDAPEWGEPTKNYQQIAQQEQTMMPDSFFRDFPENSSIIKCIPTLEPDRGLTFKIFRETPLRNDSPDPHRMRVHLSYLSPFSPTSCRDFIYLEDRTVVIHIAVQPSSYHPLSACTGFRRIYDKDRSETQLDLSLQPRLPPIPPHDPNLWDAILMSVINLGEECQAEHYLIERPSSAPQLLVYHVQL